MRYHCNSSARPTPACTYGKRMKDSWKMDGWLIHHFCPDFVSVKITVPGSENYPLYWRYQWRRDYPQCSHIITWRRLAHVHVHPRTCTQTILTDSTPTHMHTSFKTKYLVFQPDFLSEGGDLIKYPAKATLAPAAISERDSWRSIVPRDTRQKTQQKWPRKCRRSQKLRMLA